MGQRLLHYDSQWAALARHFDEEQLVELVMLAGLYQAVSFVVNAFRIPAECFAAAPPR
ncbi:MAG: hypothetical protein V2I66_09485 [Halieaceae bacterium]|nr:hypothetical protein [Halieaceae bacterium]